MGGRGLALLAQREYVGWLMGLGVWPAIPSGGWVGGVGVVSFSFFY